ncbi:hypothetical protein FQZ97_1080250 [compost metagenome]
MNLLAIAPKAEMNVTAPDWNGLSPKPSCSISGSRKGEAPMPMRNIEPAMMVDRKIRCRNRRGSSSGNCARRACSR